MSKMLSLSYVLSKKIYCPSGAARLNASATRVTSTADEDAHHSRVRPSWHQVATFGSKLNYRIVSNRNPKKIGTDLFLPVPSFFVPFCEVVVFPCWSRLFPAKRFWFKEVLIEKYGNVLIPSYFVAPSTKVCSIYVNVACERANVFWLAWFRFYWCNCFWQCFFSYSCMRTFLNDYYYYF